MASEKNKFAFYILVIFIAVLLTSCGNSEHPTPTATINNSSIANGIKLDVVDIEFMDSNQEGWRNLSVKLVIENLTNSVFFSAPLCGVLTDSGGYKRELNAQKIGDGIFNGGIFLVPKVRISTWITLPIPKNQNPQTLVLFPGSRNELGLNNCSSQIGSEWQFDLRLPLTKVVAPFDQAPEDKKSATLELNETNMYRLKLSNFQLSYASDTLILLDATVEVTNQSGDNLLFGTQKYSDRNYTLTPLLIGVNDKGNEFETDAIEQNFGIGPGVTKSYKSHIYLKRKELAGSAWYYFTLVYRNNLTEGQIVSQMLLPQSLPETNTLGVGYRGVQSAWINRNVMGSPKSKVIVQVWIDFLASNYKDFSVSIVDKIIKDYVVTGKARIEIHYFPLPQNAPWAQKGAIAVECAADQGAFWPFYDEIVKNLVSLGESSFVPGQLDMIANSLGLNEEKFHSCIQKDNTSPIDASVQQGLVLGLNRVPTVVVNGKMFNKPFDYVSIQSFIEEELSQ